MSNAPQQQNKPAQNAPSSNQGNTGKVDLTKGKVEPIAEKKTGGMKDGSCSTSKDNSSECGTKSPEA